MMRSYIKKYQSNLSKSSDATRALKKLRSFLDSKEPRLVYFLVNTWRHQGEAITYKELREAILAGEISAELLDEWRQDYARFVVRHLEPRWIEAMEAAAKEELKKFPEFNFNPSGYGIAEWTENRAAEFVTYSTNAQIEGLRAVVRQAAVLENMTVDVLARVIRPMVGLYRQQTIANLNYFTRLIENGVSEKKATDLSIRYAARHHRYRAYNIARTELAFAYNKGADFGVRQAQAAGYLGEMVKIWSTADDERTCEYCGALEGKTIAMDEEFDFKTKLTASGIRLTPPAHPSCRCAVMYKQISPPIIRQ
jgi:hypothetical protein